VLLKVHDVHTAKPGLDVGAIARAILALPHSVGEKPEVVALATVRLAMESTGGNQSAAARLLGMERKAFVRKLAHAHDQDTTRRAK
jgi:DNA-binding NtrC family response regulator